jgi:hypothetical protein
MLPLLVSSSWRSILVSVEGNNVIPRGPKGEKCVADVVRQRCARHEDRNWRTRRSNPQKKARAIGRLGGKKGGKGNSLVPLWWDASDGERRIGMAKSKRHTVTVLLTEDHLRKMIDDHLLKEEEIGDRVRVARIVQKLLNGALDLPDKPWHDWDDWTKGLE